MGPIRVGLVGLSREADPTRPGAWAAVAHLHYLKNSPDYEIVALQNSTVLSAEASIAHHKLGPATKAYGSAEDLAADPSVDMVVISVNVAKHFALTKPALLAGKDVFVEWPLGKTVAEAEELAALAKKKGVKTAVGLQARASALGAKVSEILASGKIGKVTSATALSVFTLPMAAQWPEDFAFYMDVGSGINSITIMFAHFIDQFSAILGEFKSLQSTFVVQQPTVDLIDGSGKVVRAGFPKTAPEQIMVQGTLASGAAASIQFRSGSPIDGKGMRWLITGTQGEIEITSPVMMWQILSSELTLKVKPKSSETVEDVDVPADDLGVPFPGENVARIYEAFRKGESTHATFDDAVMRHHMIEAVLISAREGRQMSYKATP